MIKKVFALLLAACLVLSVAACSAPSSTDSGTQNTPSSELTGSTNESNNQQSSDVSNASQSSGSAEKTEKLDSLEDFESIVMKDVEDSIASMTKEMEALAIEIDSFEKYKENEDKIQSFYDMICTETLRLEICLMEHASNHFSYGTLSYASSSKPS